jgi:hypothetical protein
MVSIHLLINSKYVTLLNFLTMFITSWLAYFAFLIFIHFSPMFNSSASMSITFNSALFYLDFIIIIGITCLTDFFLYSWNLNFSNNVTNSLIIERKAKGTLETNHDLPNILQKFYKIFKRMNE